VTGAERGAAPGGSGRERRHCGSGEHQETTMARRKGDGRKRGRYQREVRGRWTSRRHRLVLRRRHRRETEPSHTVYNQFTSLVTGSACCLPRRSPPPPPPTLALGLKLCRSARERFFSMGLEWSFFFGAVGMGGRWKMDEIFFGAGPTKQYFMSKPVFLMGHIFPAGKSVFRP
jgi:hypothetical protein